MDWKEVSSLDLRGERILIKDAMIQLNPDEAEPEWPFVRVPAGAYVVEALAAQSGEFAGVRVRPKGSSLSRGASLGRIEVDNASVGIIDYEVFLSAVRASPDDYDEWTGMELFDAIGESPSGVVKFGEATLTYVASGDGDGVYEVFELTGDGQVLGFECEFPSG